MANVTILYVTSYKKPMITIKINKEKQLVTHSTIIMADGKYLSLSITKHLGYQKPYQLDHKLPLPKDVKDLFEDLFYWPEEYYTNSTKLNNLAYKRLLETDFHYKSGLIYEIQWEVINIKIEKGTLTMSSIGQEKSYTTAIPPNGFDEPRYDYITDDCHYKYGCKPGEYAGRAIEIITLKK